MQKVSVIVPFYNAEEFLYDAIKSVISQSYPFWELVLVNDGSTDQGLRIAEHFRDLYPYRIKIVSHPDNCNHGMPASRNLGVSLATGDLISNLDADDVYFEDKLKNQVELMQRHPDVAMISGRMLISRSWQGGRDDVQNFTCPTDTIIKPPLFLGLLLSGKNDPAGCMIKRSVFEEVNGYPTSFEMCEDWGLYTKICLKYKLIVQSECNYKYRQHPKQTCSIAHSERRFYQKFRPFMRWANLYIKENYPEQPRIRLTVLSAMLKYQIYGLREIIFSELRRFFKN